ncbi:hypothetical protein EVAR_89748_1 [Eumeta japonica]|uniref:Uncharacterized protein n=1 Tax=Eumeta variegata TaxID=151549 RepID=A0A4C1Y500_EUMVA|nr:hypothetical protein EVAR_89748_1 [Eumeta japonica]
MRPFLRGNAGVADGVRLTLRASLPVGTELGRWSRATTTKDNRLCSQPDDMVLSVRRGRARLEGGTARDHSNGRSRSFSVNRCYRSRKGTPKRGAEQARRSQDRRKIAVACSIDDAGSANPS